MTSVDMPTGGSESEELDSFKCNDCKKTIYTNDTPAQCDFCGNVNCYKCSDINSKAQYKKNYVEGIGNNFLVPSPSYVLQFQQNCVNTFINCSSLSSLEVLRVSIDNSSENKTFDIQNDSQFVLDIVEDSPTSCSPVNFSNKVTSTPA